jgi:tetratricopeptide (TPR) repeat protein
VIEPTASGAEQVSQKLQRALACHRRGDLGCAETLYREVLAEAPADFQALHMLGVLAIQKGDHARALELIGRALGVEPGMAAAHLDMGFALRSLGRPMEALASFESAVALEPGYAKAWLHCGNVLRELGQPGKALASYERALAIRPDMTEALNNRGNALLDLGRPAEALASYDRALAARPDYAEALSNRGNALRVLGRSGEALASYERALALRPGYAQALNNRGNALLELGRAAEALASYDAALALEPENAECFNNRGNALLALKRIDEALASYERASALKPDYADPLSNRGHALFELGRAEEALACLDRALALAPGHAQAHNNRGNALCALERPEEALASYERAVALAPRDAQALANRGSVLCELRRTAQALASFEQALALDPGHAGAHWNEALCRLRVGDFEAGLPKYEWRWEQEKFKGFKRDFEQPLWLGKDSLRGKSILLHAEQGLGDAIQFCRYAPRVAALGATVLMEVQPELVSLLESLGGVHRLLARDEPLPAFDFHCPLLSLPLAFGTRLETIPREVPYLGVPVAAAGQWREKLAPHAGFRIGIGWQGNPAHHRDRSRSFALERFSGVARVPGVRLFSLQKGAGAEQVAQAASQFPIVDLSGLLDCFLTTAAIMKNLDLVIACDTAVAHLAGALGVPVWVAIPFLPDWRWQFDREDSPWYPTMRLFRQRVAGDWTGVFGEIEAALRQRLE